MSDKDMTQVKLMFLLGVGCMIHFVKLPLIQFILILTSTGPTFRGQALSGQSCITAFFFFFAF